MKTILEKLLSNAYLDRDEARVTMLRIGRNEIAPEQTVALMTAVQTRGLQLEELSGFREALLELALPVQLDTSECIDVCGTGGDGKNTFNISTTTAFVLAGMGYKVVKHGNYGVSSLCGSSNVLESLGYVFTTDSEKLQRQLDEANICFLHAPLFHPALRHVAPLRKALGVASFFNGIGPLVNPAQPAFQLTGTYSLELARQYRHVLKEKRTAFSVLHGLAGFDELTFIGETRIFGKQSDELIAEKKSIRLEDLSGGTSVTEAAAIMLTILKGNGTTAQNSVIAGNTALAIRVFDPLIDFETAYDRALESILSGKAIHHLQLNK